MNVLVSHPGLQHSHQMAWAMQEQGLLCAYWSGIPVLAENELAPIWLPETWSQRLKRANIPRSMRRHPLIFQALLRTLPRCPPRATSSDREHRVMHWFDKWVSRQLVRIRPDVVIAYENAAFHTFQAAKRIGAKCILDAASFHHTMGASLMTIPQTPYLAEINRRKDKEIQLADLVLTCSPLASESYVKAGVGSHKVKSLLLGAHVHQMTALQHREPAGPVRFIFAGALRRLKSLDLILSVFRRLYAEGLMYELIIVGNEAEPGWLAQIHKTPYARHFPGMAQSQLFELLAQSDCLLLPSRIDSFGLVVAEAMACGTPAIVSTQTGARAIIEQFPGAGWIVDCAEESLYACIKARLHDQPGLLAARGHARKAAEAFTWDAYRKRAGHLITEWMAQA